MNSKAAYQLLQQINDRQIRMEDKVEEILVQATKTNGRVTAVEDNLEQHSKYLFGQQGLGSRVHRLQQHNSKMSGIWYAILIGGPVIGFLITAFIMWVK